LLGGFNPTLGQIWTNPAIGSFLIQRLGLSIFDPAFLECKNIQILHRFILPFNYSICEGSCDTEE